MSEIVLPRLGWNMEQGIFIGWLKADGDEVKVGEPLFTVEGDKAVQEIEAIENGVLRVATNCPNEGDTVPVGTLLGHIEVAGAVPPTPPSASPASPSVRRLARELGVDLKAVVGQGPGGRITEADVRSQKAPLQTSSQAITPRARRVAKEQGVDVSQVVGSPGTELEFAL